MSRPLPAAIYWRRRFLLLAALLLLAWVVVTAWPSGSGAQDTAAPAPSPSTSASQDPDADEASEDPEPEPSPAAEQEEESATTQTTVSVAASGEPCDPESIAVAPHVPPDQSAEGPVSIQLSMSTTADEPCTFRPTAGDVVALISVDGNAVWDSDVCRSTPLLKGAVQLSPQWATVAEATWSGRGSGPACSDDEGWASPGKYALRIGTLGGEPGKTTFRITKAQAPEKAEEEPDSDDAEGEEPAEES